MHAEQQRYWVALLNLHRTWTDDEAALAFVPPRWRDFASAPSWSSGKAVAYLMNNLELLRESHRRLEAGEPLDWDLLNHGLSSLRLRLRARADAVEVARERAARQEAGGRLETLRATPDDGESNPGTRWVRAAVGRALWYFAQYVDDRLADPTYPGVSSGRWHVRERSDGSGDLVFVGPPAEAAP